MSAFSPPTTIPSSPISLGAPAGTRALILPGVTLHRGAIVAAGAIVTKDVPSMAIVAGNPARQIGVRNPALNYTTAYNRLFA